MNDLPIGQEGPHLVMAVGNHVVGDSRVEKSAITAREAGYRVTVLGLKHKSVPSLGFIDGDIPVLRLLMLNERHNAGLSAGIERMNSLAEVSPDSAISRQRQEKRSRADAVRSRRGTGLRRPRRGLRRVASRVIDSLDEVALRSAGVKSRQRIAEVLLQGASMKSEGWRDLWPQIVDYEQTFLSGFEFLKPDLIHVHDRHPMAGAVAYVRGQRRLGRQVEWLYDAHEWLPGMPYHGPASQRVGWLESEMDLIRDAKVVLTVTDALADRLRARHSLEETPAVVANAPVFARPDDGRSAGSVRTEAGLSPDDRLVVYVGGIAERRGVLDLIRACARSRIGFHVVFVAPLDPKSRSSLRECAADVGCAKRIHILDYVDANRVASYISDADVGVSVLHPSPNHDVAVPTKVREYMQAELPVVVSDVPSQAAFVRPLGIGEVAKAANPVDLAAKIDTVLTSRNVYAAHYSPSMLEEHSWERGEETLRRAWKALLGDVNPTPTPSDESRVPPDIALIEGDQKLLRDHFAISGEFGLKRMQSREPAPIPAPYFARMVTDEADQGSAAMWKRWTTDYSGLIARMTDIVEPSGFDDKSEVINLRAAGVETLRYVGIRGLDDTEMLLDTYPDHWLHDIDPDALAKRVRTSRRARDRLLKSTGIVLSPHDLTVAGFGGRAHVLPLLLDAADAVVPARRRTRFTIGIVPGPRSRAEKLILSELDHLGKRVRTELMTSDQKTEAGRYDVVVDGLSEDVPSVEGLRWMAAGSIVAVGARTATSGICVPERPLLYADPRELLGLISEYIRDAEALRQLAVHAREYVAQFHSAGRINTVLSDILA